MRQIRTWKTFTIFTILGVVLSWLVSCGSGTPTGQQAADDQLDFWTMQLSPQFDDYFKSLFAKFEQDNPGVKVRWTDVPWTEMERRIVASIAAKTDPDVVNLNPGFASQLAERGLWMNLDEKVPADVKQQYFPGIWQASTLNNKTFGVPWYLTTRVAIYNTDILKKAGIAKPPATYAELAQAAKQIKDKTGKFAFFATVVPGDSGEVMESFVQMGVQLVDAQGKAAFNSPQGKAAFQYWVDMYKNGLMPREVLTEGHRHAIDLYQQGSTAILASGAEFLKTIEKNAPSIAKASQSAPQITGDTGKKNVAVMNVAIPKGTDQPDAALKFALFLTNNENQLAFAKAANVLPSTIQSAKDAYFTTAPADATSIDKARIVSAGQLQKAEVLIPVIKNIKTLQQTIYENLQAAMLGQKTVDQALSDAAQTWNSQA